LSLNPSELKDNFDLPNLDLEDNNTKTDPTPQTSSAVVEPQRTLISELEELFGKFPDKNSALAHMRANLTGEKKYNDRKFISKQFGHTYTQGLCRKAINHLESRGQFSGSATFDPVESTFKEEKVDIPTPETTTTPQQQPEQPQTQPSDTTNFWQATTTQPAQLQQETTQFGDGFNPEAKKDSVDFITSGTMGVCNKLAELQTDPKRAKAISCNLTEAELFSRAVNKRFGGSKGYIEDADLLAILAFVGPRAFAMMPEKTGAKLFNMLLSKMGLGDMGND